VSPIRAGFLIACCIAPGLGAAQSPGPVPVGVAPPGAEIRIDGDLGDPAWSGAEPLSDFYETDPADRGEPPVVTRVRLLRDAQYLYVGIEAQDPDPAEIQASYAAEDHVAATDDQIAVFIDATHDQGSAMVFYVNPVGSRADGIWDDATFTEDLSIDLLHDSAAKIGREGWSAELRIPFSSLRYAADAPKDWHILVWRNYPRQLRHQLHSSPIPRGASCRKCFGRRMVGLGDLPEQAHWALTPYALAGRDKRVLNPGDPLQERDRRGSEREVGVDLKWQPRPDQVLDLTVNPDFSLVEADVPQVADNERFALFFPELRPFFLEGVNLWSTPIQAVHTRSITSPRWGVRGTGRLGAASYSVLSLEDRGGGSVVLPGTLSSSLVPQDFRSWVNVARLRRDAGRSYAGLLVTDRELDHDDLGFDPAVGADLENDGYNRVIGPDFRWTIGDSDTLAGQFLMSRTRTPDRTDLSPEWDGTSESGGAAVLNWSHVDARIDGFVEYRDVADGFRSDVGFVPAVGYREGMGRFGYSWYPASDWLTRIRPSASYRHAWDRDGVRISRIAAPGIELYGIWNSLVHLEVNSAELRLFDPALGREVPVSRTNFFALFQIDPARWLPRLNVNASLGPEFDYANARVGDGTRLSVTATLQPTRRLAVELIGSRESLEVDERDAAGRLFTTDIWRVKTTYFFAPGLWVRVIVQQTETDRDTDLYALPSSVASREGGLDASVVLSYRVNWRTFLDMGYGDQRWTSPEERLAPLQRRAFIRLSHAFHL